MKQLVLRTALFFISLAAGLPVFAQSYKSWAKIPIPSPPMGAGYNYWFLNQIELPNTSAIWFLGYGQERGYATYKLYSSPDDGQTWQTATFDDNTNYYSPPAGERAGNFAAIDGQQAWIIITTNPGNSTKLWHTTRGAAHMAEAAVQPPGQLGMVHFFSATTGVVVTTLPGASSAVVFRTTDGGNSWQAVNGLPGISYNGDKPFKSMGQHLWLSNGPGTGTLVHTADAGQSWRTVTTPVDFNRLSFRDSQHGLAYGTASSLYRTADGGLSWSLVSPTGPRRLGDMIGIPGSAGTYISTGSWGYVYGAAISYNEGQTWQDISPFEGANMDALAADESGRVITTMIGTHLVRYSGAPLASARAVASEKAAYPNPTTGPISLPAGQGYQYAHVYDTAGRSCFSAPLSAGTRTLDLSTLAPGLYLLRLEGNSVAPQLQRLVIAR
jgi:photosystem II stability/assembly factor-like uncharacterized protein